MKRIESGLEVIDLRAIFRAEKQAEQQMTAHRSYVRAEAGVPKLVRVRMGRQHIRETPEGPVLYVRQRKTGVELLIPIYPELRAVLDATPSEHLTFLVTATGKPYGDNHFSESFREWCDAAGLPKRCKPHGLRKAACRRLAEAGCSGNEIMAISGHVTMKELVRYTAAADQARLARNAMARTMAAR